MVEESRLAPTDVAAQAAYAAAREAGVETVWERYRAQLPQCGFGELGICCRICLQGPCRIDPFGEGPQLGICGASADTIVARNLARMVAGGTAAHAGHAHHLAHVLKEWAAGAAPDYPVRDEAKLRRLAERLGIEAGARDVNELARLVAEAALAEFGVAERPTSWAASFLTAGRLDAFKAGGLLPSGIDAAISEIMHRTTMGVDADPVNVLLGAVKTSVADMTACHMATDLADVLFGTPRPVVTEANLGLLKAGAVNVALHGHSPLLSDLLVQVAREMQEEARAAGAPEGINLVGICCTGNEVLMRHGVGPVVHSTSQELALATGCVDALVVDYQCVFPGLTQVAACFGTPVVTTMDIAKMTGATHVEFTPHHAAEKAREILRLAIRAYGRRAGRPVRIPALKTRVVAGFSVEAIVAALARLDTADPLKPLIDNIVNGNIRGVALFAGCNNVKIPQDSFHLSLARRLLEAGVLVLATGCAAGAFARHGLLDPAATPQVCRPGLAAVLQAIGEANELGGPLPPALHIGSCVDNSRAVDIAVALANRLGVDLPRLPVVATAPEPMTEKAVAIGTWAVALGLPVHVGLAPPVLGSKLVTEVLTRKVKELLGGQFVVATEPEAAAEALLAIIDERRKGLGL